MFYWLKLQIHRNTPFTKKVLEMTSSSTKVKTPAEVITDLNVVIADLSNNLEKTNAAHIATKVSASQHIGALRTQLANCKCPVCTQQNQWWRMIGKLSQLRKNDSTV